MFRISILLLFILAGFSCGKTQSQTQIQSTDDISVTKTSVSKVTEISSQLQQIFNQWLKCSLLQNATVGFYAIDTKTGKTLAQLNPDLSISPASSQKLLTTASALEILGENFQFTTQLQYDGTIDKVQKKLVGNIYIKGGGDPVLCSHRFGSCFFFEECIKKIKALGITRIEGNIIADAQIYKEDIPPTWSWEDMGNYYGAGACGLSIYDNEFDIYYKSGNKNGASTQVTKVFPKIPNLVIRNEVKASDRKGDNSVIFGSPNNPERIIRGTIPKNHTSFKVRGSIPEPDYLVAYQLDSLLRKNGITLTQRPTTIRRLQLNGKNKTAPRQTIYTNTSPLLKDIVITTNKWSINLYAEHFLKQIGLTKYSEATIFAGTKAIKELWESKGMNTKGLLLYDGSGLSRCDGITPQQFVFLLNYVKKQPYFATFKASLPVVGTSGTLLNMCRTGDAKGRVFAKTGTTKNVRTLTGYAQTKSGNEIAFALLINNYSGELEVLNKYVEKMLEKMVNLSL